MSAYASESNKETNSILNEESYCVDIFIDIIKDEYCLYTRYRFKTNELAEQFLKFLDNKINVIYDEIVYEEIRSLLGYTDTDPYRPRFSNIESAIEDFDKFIEYSYGFNEFKNDSYDSYIYKGNVFTENLDEFNKRYLEKKVKMLEIENQELKLRLSKYEVV